MNKMMKLMKKLRTRKLNQNNKIDRGEITINNSNKDTDQSQERMKKDKVKERRMSSLVRNLIGNRIIEISNRMRNKSSNHHTRNIFMEIGNTKERKFI